MQTQTIRQHYGEDHQRLDELFHRFQELKRTDHHETGRLFAEFKIGSERHIMNRPRLKTASAFWWTGFGRAA